MPAIIFNWKVYFITFLTAHHNNVFSLSNYSSLSNELFTLILIPFVVCFLTKLSWKGTIKNCWWKLLLIKHALNYTNYNPDQLSFKTLEQKSACNTLDPSAWLPNNRRQCRILFKQQYCYYLHKQDDVYLAEFFKIWSMKKTQHFSCDDTVIRVFGSEKVQNKTKDQRRGKTTRIGAYVFNDKKRFA